LGRTPHESLCTEGGKERQRDGDHLEETAELHLLLDFTNVDRINSEELGTLIGAHKAIVAAGGRLTLFNLNPDVYEVFTATRLHTLLGSCRCSSAPLPSPLAE
jgi:anti-anti-sigma regulatory factor